eukprot:2182013-Pleurochrysis_carterae.AAC.1
MNFQSVKAHVLRTQVAQRVFMKDMDTDAERLKNLLLNRIGRKWATATRSNTQSTLGLTRGQVPWKEVSDAMSQSGSDTSTHAFVARHVRNLTNTYYSFAA